VEKIIKRWYMLWLYKLILGKIVGSIQLFFGISKFYLMGTIHKVTDKVGNTIPGSKLESSRSGTKGITSVDSGEHRRSAKTIGFEVWKSLKMDSNFFVHEGKTSGSFWEGNAQKWALD